MILHRFANKAVHKGIFVLVVLFLAYSVKVSFAEGSEELSGKYKGCNVILILLDALRPDHLSCYGYGKETSPNIDTLAKEGVLFSNAFSQASYTLPSVTSIFTSVYPYSHGVKLVFKDTLPDTLCTLAGVLSTYGYKTAWFGKLSDPHSGRAPGVLKGFEEKYQEETSSEIEGRLHWIKSYSREPFFITIHSYSVHEQTFPFRKFDNMISRSIPKDSLGFSNESKQKSWDKIQETYKNDPEKINGILGHELWRLISSLNKEQLKYFLSLLDSAIYEADQDIIGTLVKTLKELNLYEKTIIIVTADHGNEFMEHGDFGHGKALYDESIHVPFIYYLPHLNKAVTVNELAESMDILPTTLDLLGIDIPHQVQGISLVGLMERKKNASRNEYVYCMGVPEGTIAIRSKDWKLFLKPEESGGSEKRLFNLKKDPRELKNVYKDNPKVARQLNNLLEEWRKNLVVYKNKESEFVPGISEETRNRIKKTGYW
jgi:arylsulfatase A-like enzyme